MIKSIKFDHINNHLIIVHNIRIHGNSYENNEFGEEIAVPASFDSQTETIITFSVAEACGIINIGAMEKMIRNSH